MSEVKVDTISERTAAGGVTIDGVLIKDGVATFQTPAGSPLVFEGATANAFETTFAITDPTADRTITFPDESITLGASHDATPKWLAYIGSDQSLTSNVDATYDYDTEVFDSDSAFDTGTHTFTVPVGEAGVYFAFAYSYHAGTNSNAHQLANIQINMGSLIFWEEIDQNGYYGKAYSVGVNGLAVLAEGDTISVHGKSIFYAGTVVLQANLIRSAFGGWRIA